MSEAAQSRILAARVLVLGLEESGATAARHLAEAGVGNLALIDPGVVSSEDLHFQPLYTQADRGRPRVAAAKLRLETLNADTRVDCIQESFNAHTAEDMLERYDLVLDALTDWQDKLLASDACMKMMRPLIHVGVSGFAFQLFTMVPGKSACLRCVFSQVGIEDLPAPDARGQRFAPVYGMAGAFQALEAAKLIARLGVSACDELVRFDGIRRTFHATAGLTPRGDCPDCGRRFP